MFSPGNHRNPLGKRSCLLLKLAELGSELSIPVDVQSRKLDEICVSKDRQYHFHIVIAVWATVVLASGSVFLRLTVALE